MNIKERMPRAAICGIAVVSLLLASCQGRTASNMVPKGETVEVVVAEPADADSTEIAAPQPTDSLQTIK